MCRSPEHHDMVETFASDRSDQPRDMNVSVGRDVADFQ
jgi:hypothetical protein